MRLILNNKAFIISIFLLALIGRLIALFVVEPISNPKTWEYEVITNNFLQGKGLFYTFYATPYRATYIILYPLLCSVVYVLTNHSFLALKLLQIFISLITCLLIYRISLKLFNQRVAILALFLVGLHPGLVYYSVRLHSLVLDTFLYTLSIFFLLKVLDGKNIHRNAIFSGISFGLAILARPAIGPFLIFALFIIFLKFRKSRFVSYTVVSLIIITTTLTILPLWVKNYLVFNKIVLVPSESGLNFWLGYNKDATGTNKTLKGEFIFDVAPEQFRKTILSMDEFGQKEYFYKEGISFVKAHPFKSLSLFFKKIKYFWWFTPTQGQEYPKLYFIIYKLYWMFILPLFIFGLYRKFREGLTSLTDKYNTILIIIFLITITLAHASFNLDGRHRWVVESFLLIFAANGISCLLRKED